MTSKTRRSTSTSPASPLDLRWDRRGLHLARGALSFDAAGAGGATFLGHALVGLAPAGLAPAGQRIITSDLTARLLGARLGPALATPFHRPFSLGPLELELLPSGFVPGAAALAIRQGNQVLLYAGEVGQGAPLCGLPAAAPRRCDHLVLRPFAAEPGFQRPPAEETFGQLVDFALRAGREGRVTLLHGSPLGPLQAVLAPLRAAGIPVRAHRQIHRFFGPLRAAGVSLGPVPRFEGEAQAGEVLLWPVEPAVRIPGRGAPGLVRALLSGRRATPARLAEAGCERAFPLGNALCFDALEAYVAACGPSRVTLLGARAPALERSLVVRGIRVETLGLPPQLLLPGVGAGSDAGGAYSQGS